MSLIDNDNPDMPAKGSDHDAPAQPSSPAENIIEDTAADAVSNGDDHALSRPEDESILTDGAGEEEGHRDHDAEAEAAEKEKEKAEAESDRFLRLAAEFDNYRKRTAREFEDVVRMANVRLLRSLVDIIDNFERALNTDPAGNEVDAYRKGVELIHNQLADLLKKERVTPIEAVGHPFDPNYHEALLQAESDEYEEGIISQEIQKGYRIDDKVLRHARVIVSRGRPGRENDNNQAADK